MLRPPKTHSPVQYRQTGVFGAAPPTLGVHITNVFGWPCIHSGRSDSNRRRPAWEAGILPLNYARNLISFKIQGLRRPVKSLPIPLGPRLIPLDAVSYSQTSRFLPAKAGLQPVPSVLADGRIGSPPAFEKSNPIARVPEPASPRHINALRLVEFAVFV